jgi:rubredoxin
VLWYDSGGVGYVSMRGTAKLCSKEEATAEYWTGWDFFYPNGSSCPFYSLLRFEPDEIEYVSVSRFKVVTTRADWLPATLTRTGGVWGITVPPDPAAPTPAPAPTPPTPPTPPPAEHWVCSVCAHVYDPAVDGGGKPFEKLPDSFKCPVCGAPKSAFHRQTGADGRVRWVHDHPSASASAPPSDEVEVAQRGLPADPHDFHDRAVESALRPGLCLAVDPREACHSVGAGAARRAARAGAGALGAGAARPLDVCDTDPSCAVRLAPCPTAASPHGREVRGGPFTR